MAKLKERKYINKEQFESIEPGDKLVTRFMSGEVTVLELPEDGDVLVNFKGGPWNGKTLKLIRQQITKIN